MKYFICCKNCFNKFYINTHASVRSELPSSFNINCNYCNTSNHYLPFDVTAETYILGSQGMAILGGLVGILGGGAGALLGIGIGAAIGKNSEKKERLSIQRFNHS